MKEFKYDVIELIRGVKDRPCLWNKSLEVYKDRVERRKAWEEIFNLLEERYETMSSEEKRLTGEHVLNKWTNIRDTFVKSLRLKMGKPRRKYILYDHLTFLVKSVNQEDNNRNDSTADYPDEVTYLKEERQSEDEVEEIPIIQRTEYAPKRTRRAEESREQNTSRNDANTSRRKSRKKEEVRSKSKEYDSSGIDFIEVDENASADPRLMNEDEAFFASLLPTVVKYNESERLEFRLQVLGVMKSIKDSRWSED